MYTLNFACLSCKREQQPLRKPSSAFSDPVTPERTSVKSPTTGRIQRLSVSSPEQVFTFCSSRDIIRKNLQSAKGRIR